jgi:UMF1 family MFS transporter
MNLDIQFYSFRWIDRNGTRAIQSLSRSTYSKLLPETEDHATYFSFFDVTEKYLIVLEPFGHPRTQCEILFYFSCFFTRIYSP